MELVCNHEIESIATRKAIIQGTCNRFFYDGMAHCPLVLVDGAHT
jgi:hypothetical protein